MLVCAWAQSRTLMLVCAWALFLAFEEGFAGGTFEEVLCVVVIRGAGDGKPFFEFRFAGRIGLFEDGGGFAAQNEVDRRLGVFDKFEHYFGCLGGVAHGLEVAAFEEFDHEANALFIAFDFGGVGHGVAGPVGAEAARFDTDDFYAEGRHFFGEDFGEPAEAEFRGLIDAQTGLPTRPPIELIWRI